MSNESHKDTFEFELGATLKSGVHVPIEVVVTYPEGMGLHAIQSLKQAMETQSGAMFQQLVNQNDASVISALLASGHAYEEDED